MDQYEQKFSVTKENKLKFGEIYTPFHLIEKMFNMLPLTVFTDKEARWLDPGAGTGYFSLYLYHKLQEGLSEVIPDEAERHGHIVRNMLFMVEIQDSNVAALKTLFGEEANIIHSDYLGEKLTVQFDYVIGNPPYNANGLKKVPTNTVNDKKEDGRTVWISFIKRSISLLKAGGSLLFIVPSIWMKPDRARTYHYLTSFKLNKIHCLTNTQTNAIFNGEAQTPTCFFLLSKQPSDGLTQLYDKDLEEYIEYSFKPEDPLPVFGQSVIRKLKPFRDMVGSMNVVKTNLPSKESTFQKVRTGSHTYPNIRTCILNGLIPQFVVEYSNLPQAFRGIRKLIMAHKMYGFPAIDRDGDFGISNRDNYVIQNKDMRVLERFRTFLGTKTALYLFEATRYRMKYLEKYIFQLIPDITKLPNFPETITDETIADFFGFSDLEREGIRSLHRKEYEYFPEVPMT